MTKALSTRLFLGALSAIFPKPDNLDMIQNEKRQIPDRFLLNISYFKKPWKLSVLSVTYTRRSFLVGRSRWGWMASLSPKYCKPGLHQESRILISNMRVRTVMRSSKDSILGMKMDTCSLQVIIAQFGGQLAVFPGPPPLLFTRNAPVIISSSIIYCLLLSEAN